MAKNTYSAKVVYLLILLTLQTKYFIGHYLKLVILQDVTNFRLINIPCFSHSYGKVDIKHMTN